MNQSSTLLVRNECGSHFRVGPGKKIQPLEKKLKGFTPTNPWKKNLIPWKRNLSTQPEPGWRGVWGGGRSASPPDAFAKHAT